MDKIVGVSSAIPTKPKRLTVITISLFFQVNMRLRSGNNSSSADLRLKPNKKNSEFL